MSEVVFLFWPTNYLLSIELVGAVGEAMLRGLGVLFIMWNVPYSVAMWHPIHRTIPHFEAPELLPGLIFATYVHMVFTDFLSSKVISCSYWFSFNSGL
jgi:hypothetical protein